MPSTSLPKTSGQVPKSLRSKFFTGSLVFESWRKGKVPRSELLGPILAAEHDKTSEMCLRNMNWSPSIHAKAHDPEG